MLPSIALLSYASTWISGRSLSSALLIQPRLIASLDGSRPKGSSEENSKPLHLGVFYIINLNPDRKKKRRDTSRCPPFCFRSSFLFVFSIYPPSAFVLLKSASPCCWLHMKFQSGCYAGKRTANGAPFSSVALAFLLSGLIEESLRSCSTGVRFTLFFSTYDCPDGKDFGW